MSGEIPMKLKTFDSERILELRTGCGQLLYAVPFVAMRADYHSLVTYI